MIGDLKMEKNIFSECEKSVTEKDFALVEQDLAAKLPVDFKEHYIKFNGGTPKNTIWADVKHDYLEVRDFMPLLYNKSFGDDPDFTLNGIAKDEWGSRKLPPTFLPFAMDWGGNYFCIELDSGNVYYFVRDVWSDNISIEKNLEINSIYVTDSIKTFVDNLTINDED